MPTEDVLLRIKVEGDFGEFRNFLEKNNLDNDKCGFGITDSDGEQIFAMEVESEWNYSAISIGPLQIHGQSEIGSQEMQNVMDVNCPRFS